MRLVLLLLLCFLSVSQSWSAKVPRQITVAKQFLGMVEEAENSGKQVNLFLKSVGLKPGNSWCAAFVRFVLDSAKCEFKVRSGLASKYITKNAIKAKHVAKGYQKVTSGWLVIWQKYDTAFGHIGFVQSWDKDIGQTIEGNIKPDTPQKSTRDGVFEKKRKITDIKSFRIIAFQECY